jgi:Domain of unknown function (DUF4277)
MIDARLLLHDQEEITAGEAGAGMILHGLGFAHRPWAFTPQVFTNKPRDLFFREGVRAERFNRLKRGRPLAEVSTYGCDLLVSALALAVWAQEGMDDRVTQLDTPSFSLPGAYGPDSDEPALVLPHGDATAHRPALQQAVLELLVSQAGGVPRLSKPWDGKASATPLFPERAHALSATLREAPRPRSLVAAAQRSTEDHAPTLAQRGCSTRMPGTLTRVTQGIPPALREAPWQPLEARTREQRIEWGHYGLAQRWLVVWSQASRERAEASGNQAGPRAAEAMHNQLVHLQARRCAPQPQAHEAWAGLAKTWRDHQGASCELLDHKRSGNKGRPPAETPSHAIAWPLQAPARLHGERLEAAQPHAACLGLGTNIETEQLREAEVSAGSKAPSPAEGGCRCLKAPVFFVSSLVGKKPCRMQGLWRVMTLALLGSSVAPRRLRRA